MISENKAPRLLGLAFVFVAILSLASGLLAYPSLFDQFLIVVGLGFNVLTVWRVWRWKSD